MSRGCLCIRFADWAPPPAPLPPRLRPPPPHPRCSERIVGLFSLAHGCCDAFHVGQRRRLCTYTGHQSAVHPTCAAYQPLCSAHHAEPATSTRLDPASQLAPHLWLASVCVCVCVCVCVVCAHTHTLVCVTRCGDLHCIQVSRLPARSQRVQN